MSNHDEQQDEHFDELDAVRRFPSEDTWLKQPLPDLQDADTQKSDQQKSGSQDGDSSSTSFADRVMSARQDDLNLDAQIAELDQALPTEVLQQFGAPKPSDSFVDKAVQKVIEERRQRWQKMLSRYVAPEPSTEFVSRTLAALQDGSSDSKRTGAHAPLQAPLDHHRRRQNWTVFGLVGAAAAALLWVRLTGDIRKPLEVRLADQASPAVAYASSTSPMSAILARVADDEEPFAIFDEPVDGLWLISDTDSEELR
ncbi:MAG: hypothetical protein ACI89X_000047 [Planctomycetota bacterium]|jgi:hypothetical protein